MIDKKIDINKDIQIVKQIDRKKDGQINRKKYKKIERRIDLQEDIDTILLNLTLSDP